MHKFLARWSVPSAVFLLVIGSSWSTATAQPAPWHIGQGSDGTLYLVTGDTRYVVSPDAISDDDLAALRDGGSLGGQLPMPPAPSSIISSAPATGPAAPTQNPTPVPPAPVPLVATPTPTPEQSVTVTGQRDDRTKLITLRGGNYTISWTVTSLSNYDGTFTGLFTSATQVDPLNNSLLSFGSGVNSRKTASGQTNLYNLPGGQYYIAGISSGTEPNISWTVTVAPQSIQASVTSDPPVSTDSPSPAPTPSPLLTGPIFKGDPREITQVSDFGPGWAIVSQVQNDANQYSSGPLLTTLGKGDKQARLTLYTNVEVFQTLEGASSAWQDTRKYFPNARPINVCDESAATQNNDGTALLECRVKNVRLIVNFASFELSLQGLGLMADRVNAGAR